MVQEGSRRFKKVKEGSKRYNRINKDSTASWGWAVPSLGQIKAWYNVYWAQSARISPTMRHGKMFLRNEGENKSVLTPIWEGRILPPELKLCGEGSAFFQNKICESDYNMKIHEIHFYEKLVPFSKQFSIILAFTALWAINNKEMAAFSKLRKYPLNLI